MIHHLYCHIVWTTRDRQPLIDAGLARFLCRFLRQIARGERAHVLEIGMVTTHVHLLARLHPMTSLTRLLQRMKGSSASVAGKERHSTEGHHLRWAKAYAIRSVSPRALPVVREYLRAQPIRHPEAAIAGWKEDQEEYDPAGQDEWRSELRRGL